MKIKSILVVGAVLFIVRLLTLTSLPAKAQTTLSLGNSNLTVAPNVDQSLNMWERMNPPTGLCSPANLPNGSAVTNAWHYGHVRTTTTGSQICDYNSGSRNYGGLVSPIFTSTNDPTLHFWSLLDLKDVGPGYDVAQILLSKNGGDFSNFEVISKANLGSWVEYNRTLTGCGGHQCQLMFWFDTKDSTNNLVARASAQIAKGWHIANFSITGSTTPGATPTFTPTPTPVIGGTVEVSCAMAQVGVDMRDNVTRPFWVKIWVNSDRTGPPRHTFEGSFSNIVGVVAVFNPVLQGVNTIIVEYAVGNTVSGGYTLHDTVVRGLTCPPVYKDYLPFIAK